MTEVMSLSAVKFEDFSDAHAHLELVQPISDQSPALLQDEADFLLKGGQHAALLRAARQVLSNMMAPSEPEKPADSVAVVTRSVSNQEVINALKVADKLSGRNASHQLLARQQSGIDVRVRGRKYSDDGSSIDATNWVQFRECSSETPDERFVRGAEQNKAKKICESCLVKDECLGEALDNKIEWGVWGGTTERERRAILKRAKNAI